MNTRQSNVILRCRGMLDWLVVGLTVTGAVIDLSAQCFLRRVQSACDSHCIVECLWGHTVAIILL